MLDRCESANSETNRRNENESFDSDSVALRLCRKARVTRRICASVSFPQKENLLALASLFTAGSSGPIVLDAAVMEYVPFAVESIGFKILRVGVWLSEHEIKVKHAVVI